MLPEYLAIGMSADEFWRGDVCLAGCYRKAHKLRQDQRNTEAWMQGLYTYIAICRASPLLIPFNQKPEALPYLEEPIPLDEKQAKEQKERRERERMEQMQAMFRAKAVSLNLQLKGREG